MPTLIIIKLLPHGLPIHHSMQIALADEPVPVTLLPWHFLKLRSRCGRRDRNATGCRFGGVVMCGPWSRAFGDSFLGEPFPLCGVLGFLASLLLNLVFVSASSAVVSTALARSCSFVALAMSAFSVAAFSKAFLAITSFVFASARLSSAPQTGIF